MLGNLTITKWLQVCSEEAVKSLRYLKVSFKANAREREFWIIDCDKGGSPFRGYVVMLLVTRFLRHGDQLDSIIDLKQGTFTCSDKIDSEHPLIVDCQDGLQEWVDKLKCKNGNDTKPLTKNHLLKLVW